jgi:hypothetical protein
MRENKSDCTLIIVLIVLTAVLFIPTGGGSDGIKEQRERIELWEQTKNSSDPVIRKQAEIIKMDTEKEYQKRKSDNEVDTKNNMADTKNSDSNELSKPLRLFFYFSFPAIALALAINFLNFLSAKQK